MPTELNTKDLLTRFASTISQQPLGLVTHAPEPWADAAHCIANVLRKISLDGGQAVFGWVFLDRHSPKYGPYLIAQNHVVWNASGCTNAVDITKFHENPKHRPYSPGGSVLFLLDDAAKPRTIGHVIAPLPSRFYPANDDPQLAAYIDMLRANEAADCEAIYEAARASHGSSAPRH